MMSKRKKDERKVNSAFAKFRSMIWINLITLIILLIAILIANKLVAELFSQYRIVTWVVLSFFVLVYNFGFFGMYKMAKQFILYNLLSLFIIMTMAVMITFFVKTNYHNEKIFLIVGLFLSLVPLIVSSFFQFKRVREIYKYIAFNETLYELESRKFLKNDKEIKLKLFLKPGHFYIEENGVRRKFSVSNLSTLKYNCATIFGSLGKISFKIDNDLYEYKYSSAFEDGVMFSLAYNIARINKNALNEKG
ncbi:hypothetical protein SCHIN_v1c02050 [Spiroplasma chinense]|uniref:Uncharacterized protein n=1 Tax=Spiroplasma chinense TaxID=216932 RepID=A0A5B9Y3S1_9MOLU|nr:hypothetical protein [Spiroplasma chinense]QEH61403.1 hypothetical protein SCHIN_v1c02050 [Spiroplasma chinense]